LSFTSAVTLILLKEHFKTTLIMHSHCALSIVTVQEKLLWINLDVKGAVRWNYPVCQLMAVEADFLVVMVD
jgi:hypothetical protein